MPAQGEGGISKGAMHRDRVAKQAASEEEAREMLKKRKVTAVVLAAGKGSRMGTSLQKQYLKLAGRPLLCHTLEAFERSLVDQVILVTGSGEEAYCRQTIVEGWGFTKVSAIVLGGKERYDSVYEGLKAAEGCEDVLIHDGARPCVTVEIINAAIDGAVRYGACAVGMPVKDTIKITDQEGNVSCTPDRGRLWLVQTPQAFSYALVREAYDRLFHNPSMERGITDDAMVVETMTRHKVHLIRGSYENIKVTTPEDLEMAGIILRRQAESKADTM